MAGGVVGKCGPEGGANLSLILFENDMAGEFWLWRLAKPFNDDLNEKYFKIKETRNSVLHYL